MSKPKVVVAGHICIDITPIFPTDSANAAMAQKAIHEILIPGTLTRVRGVDIHAGGVVANTGLAMVLFGADVSLMGKVGKDAFGSMILSLLRESNSSDAMIVSDGASTSYSVVIAIPGCDRIFLHDPGANDDFRFSDLDFEKIRSSSLFHFGYPTLMASMFRNGGDELTKMFRAIDGAGIITSLDLAAVDEKSEAGKANWERILADTLPSVDFFMPSFEELAFMLDRGALERIRARTQGEDPLAALSVDEDVPPLAERAIALGARVVLIKCGKKGLYYRTATREKMESLAKKVEMQLEGIRCMEKEGWIDRNGFEKSYVPEQVLSATGAGDTTIAAFLAAMLEGYPFERCLELATATGASCVESYDALGGLRSFADLEKKIDAGWKKSW